MHCWCSELMCKLLISLDLDLKLDNAIISLALSFCYPEGNNVGHKIPVISTTFHAKQRIYIGREENRKERHSEIGCYHRPNWAARCRTAAQDAVLHTSTFIFLFLNSHVCRWFCGGIIDSKISTSSLSVLFLFWVLIILHVFIIKKKKIRNYFSFLIHSSFFFSFQFCLKYKHDAEQPVYKHTEVQDYSICILICFLDKWLLATSIIQREKQWKYRGITFVYFFPSCQLFLLGFCENIKKIRKSSSLKDWLGEHLFVFRTSNWSECFNIHILGISHADISLTTKQYSISLYTIRLCLCKIQTGVKWR